MNQISVQSKEVLEVDLLSALLHARVAKVFNSSLTDYQERVPATILTACMRVNREIDDLERKILNMTQRSHTYLRKEIQKDKVFDIAKVTELILRIGREENSANYEEFLSLMIDCIDTVLYTAENRKNLLFQKYKALFNLITSEMKLDVAGTQGQVIYRNGQIFLRTAPPESPTHVI